MRTSELYRDKAAECLAAATMSKNETERASFLELALAWLLLLERTTDPTSFTSSQSDPDQLQQ